jgi:hypothetical protein
MIDQASEWATLQHWNQQRSKAGAYWYVSGYSDIEPVPYRFRDNPTLNSGGPLKHVCVGETCLVAEPNPESLAMTMVKL